MVIRGFFILKKQCLILTDASKRYRLIHYTNNNSNIEQKWHSLNYNNESYQPYL